MSEDRHENSSVLTGGHIENHNMEPVQLDGIPISIESPGVNRRSRPTMFYVDQERSLPSDISVGREDFNTIYHRAEHTATELIKRSDRQAKIYRAVSVLNTFVTIVTGVVVGVVNLQNYDEQTRYVSTVLGLSSAALQTAVTVFNIDKISILAKEVSAKAKNVLRNLRKYRLKNHHDPNDVLQLEGEIEDLDFSLFVGTSKSSN